MNIEFLDANTVKINWSLNFVARTKDKTIITRGDVQTEFLKKHKSYNVVSIEGPERITNFTSRKFAEGEWNLKVEKKSKLKSNPKPKPKTTNTTTRNLGD